MPAIELTEMAQAVLELVETKPAPGKHCIRNAYRHLQKAWLLDGVDLEMAGFRAITAEEEAASGLFHALRHRRYRGAEKLPPRLHVQKNAVVPFCTAVAGVLAGTQQIGLKSGLHLDKSEKPWRFRVWADVEPLTGQPLRAYPEPPLHFIISDGDEPLDFSEQLRTIAQRRNVSEIRKYIEKRANQRNRLLYAANQGALEVTTLNNFLPKQRQNVFILSILYMMIDPYPEKQLFVQQALQAFLKMLKMLPGEMVFE